MHRTTYRIPNEEPVINSIKTTGVLNSFNNATFMTLDKYSNY